MNLGQLLERAKSGLLKCSEISLVAERLSESAGSHDAYTLIHILGCARATQYEKLVQRFLNSPSDPTVARIALQTLCNYWGKAGNYRAEVLAFLRGIAWDVDDEARLAALSIAGEFLRISFEGSLLEEVIRVWENEKHSPIVRQAAYFALSRARGANWNELPPASRQLDLKAVDLRVVEWAKNQLASHQEG
jgi:hypothetical protein